MANSQDPVHLVQHVMDQRAFELPGGVHLAIPQPFEALGFTLTKFMLLEVLAATLVAAAFIGLARRIADGRPPKGRLWNFCEVFLLFVRDDIVRQAMGRDDGDRYLPLLWTIFMFIATYNLLGLIPWLGSATGAFATTSVLALVTFAVVLGTGAMKLGPIGFLKGQVPHMDLPLAIAVVLLPLLFVIEIFGLFMKHFVLSIRLMANMFAGHVVLVVIMSFIVQVAGTWMALFVWPAALFGATFISLLELFVALLQAYIFTFLSALFIGMARHPH